MLVPAGKWKNWGRVRWRHAPHSDELWFYSPLGVTVARLKQDRSGALLITSDGHEYRAADLQQLALKVLGWDLPIEGLPYWVRGLEWPAVDAAQETFDKEGRPKQLSQAGWEISYLDWTPAGVALIDQRQHPPGGGDCRVEGGRAWPSLQ